MQGQEGPTEKVTTDEVTEVRVQKEGVLELQTPTEPGITGKEGTGRVA